MSELLFPRVRSRRGLEFRLAALATATLVLFGIFSLWLGASFVGLIGGDVVATARVAALGDSIGVNSGVKFRGVRVGRVVSVDSSRDRDGLYAVHLIVDDEFASEVPANARARILPGTLFGAEYVELAGASAGPMVHDGTVFAADTSEESIRLMDTFSALHRVISAVDPAALDLAVSHLARALDGRGADIHDAVGRIGALVDDYTRAEPTFYRDLDHLTDDLDTLADVEPELAKTLKDALPLARTIARRDDEIDALVGSSTRLSSHVSTFLGDHGDTLALMLDELAPTYRTFVTGRPEFTQILHLAPPVLRNGATAIDDGAISMKAKFSVQIGNPYTSADCPRYPPLMGGNCP